MKCPDVIIGAMLLSAVLPSCGIFSAYGNAKARAADELGCPEDKVEQRYHARHSVYLYRFAGCGREVTIECMYGPDRLRCRRTD